MPTHRFRVRTAVRLSGPSGRRRWGRKKGFEQLVYAFGGFLLRPMRNARQITQFEIADVALRSVRRFLTERDIAFAPQHEGRNLDRRETARDLRVHTPARCRAIPVQHRGEGTRLRGLIAIDVNDVVRKARRLELRNMRAIAAARPAPIKRSGSHGI